MRDFTITIKTDDENAVELVRRATEAVACIGWDDQATVSIEAVEEHKYHLDRGTYLAGYELEPGLEVEWLIRQIQDEDGETLYWSNENGWGSIDDATLFTSEERSCYSLPQGGEWA